MQKEHTKEQQQKSTSYFTKRVTAHPDIHVLCTQCDRHIIPDAHEYFINLAGPGFCCKACMNTYYANQRNK